MAKKHGELDHSDSNVKEESSEDVGRSAAIAALQAIIDIDPAGGQVLDPEHHTALFKLYLALRSLDYGKVHEILKPSPVENRPPDSLDMRCNKALAAAAMDVLMQPVAGVERKSEEQAARYVARITQSKKTDLFKAT
jgi:hypothetical protein